MKVFTFREDWYGLVKHLPDDQRLEVYDAVMKMAFDGEEQENLSPLAKVVVDNIANGLSKRTKACERKRKSRECDTSVTSRGHERDMSVTSQSRHSDVTPEVDLDVDVKPISGDSEVLSGNKTCAGKEKKKEKKGFPPYPLSKEEKEEEKNIHSFEGSVRGAVPYESRVSESGSESESVGDERHSPASRGPLDASSARPKEAKKKKADLPAVPRVVVASMILNSGEQEQLFEDELLRWKELYPAVDVMQEIRKMQGWIEANPTRRKTKRGLRRFVNSWLSKAQDQAGQGKVVTHMHYKADNMNSLAASMIDSGALDYALRKRSSDTDWLNGTLLSQDSGRESNESADIDLAEYVERYGR